MNDFRDVILLLVGWLLGLLSPPLVDRIQRKYKQAEVRSAILNELRELQFTMMAFAFGVRTRMGKVDSEFLQWMTPIYERYRGSEEDKELVSRFQQLKALPPEQLRAVQAPLVSSFRGLSLKTYSVPYIEAQYASLSLFKPAFQQRVLQVKAKLAAFNEEVAFLMRQFELTFSTLSSENRAVVSQNLNSGYEKLSSIAVTICRLIDEIPKG